MFLRRLFLVIGFLLLASVSSHATTIAEECQKRAMSAYDRGSSDAERQRLGARAASECFREMDDSLKKNGNSSSSSSSSSSNSGSHPGDNPFIVGISFGSILAIAVFWLVGSNTHTDIGAYKGVKWLSGGILTGVGLLLLAAFAKGGSSDGMGSFVFWGYIFFSLPHVLLIWWTRKNAIADGLNDTSSNRINSDEKNLKVVKSGEAPEVFRKLMAEIESGEGDGFVRELAILGLKEVQGIVKSIDPNLHKEEKFKIAIKKIASLTCESESIAKIWFSTYTFGYLFDNCKGFESEAMQQGLYYGLFKNAEECTIPLHANFDYYLMIGYCAKFSGDTGGKISSRSLGGWDDAKNIIETKIVYRKNNALAVDYFERSLAAAELSIELFRSKLSTNSLEKACHKLSSYGITPIYSLLTNSGSFVGSGIGVFGDHLKSNSLKYPGLNGLLNAIQVQRDSASAELRSLANAGTASSVQLKELSDKVESNQEKFSLLARALIKSLDEISKKSVLTLPALKKLDEYWGRFNSDNEKSELKDIQGFSTYGELVAFLKAKLAIKKVLDKGLKDGQISTNNHLQILSSLKNFPCPMCAEVIGDKVTECPYCQHHLE